MSADTNRRSSFYSVVVVLGFVLLAPVYLLVRAGREVLSYSLGLSQATAFVACLTGRLALISVVLTLISCSNWHARRAQHHIDKLESRGATWKRDTVWQEFKFTAPSVTNSLTVNWPQQLKDTVIVTQDSIQIRWFPKVVKEDTLVYVEIKCPEQDVKGKVPVAINNELQARGGKWWIWVLIALVVGVLGGWYLTVKYYRVS